MMVSEVLLLNDNVQALYYAQQSYDVAVRTKADGLQYTKQYLQYVKTINENNNSDNAFNSCINILNNYINFNKFKVALSNKFIKNLHGISITQKNEISNIISSNGGSK